MDYLTTSEAAEKWNISRRRVTVLCSTGRIPGALQKGGVWLIPKKAKNRKMAEKYGISDRKSSRVIIETL